YGAFSHEVRDARGAQRGGDLPAAPDCCTGATGTLRGTGRVRVAWGFYRSSRFLHEDRCVVRGDERRARRQHRERRRGGEGTEGGGSRSGRGRHGHRSPEPGRGATAVDRGGETRAP